MADTRIEELRRRLERDPGSRLFAQLAEELRKGGELAESIGVARSGLAAHPGYASARLTLGRALLDSGDANGARVELESALRDAPDNILASRFLALAKQGLGDLQGAAEQYRKTLQMAPGDRQLQGQLAAVEVLMRAPVAAAPGAAAPGTTAAANPVEPRRAPPPLPPGSVRDAPATPARGTPGSVPPLPGSEPGARRAAAPPVVFAPSRPAAPVAPEPAEDASDEGGPLPATLRIRSAQALPPHPPPAVTGPPAGEPAPVPPAARAPAPVAAPGPPDSPAAGSEPEPKPEPAAAAATGMPQHMWFEPGESTARDGAHREAAEAAPASPDASTPFSSSTLAELYVQQGLVDRAVDVYRQVLAQEPENERARSRLAELARAPGAPSDRSGRRRALERTIAGLETLLAAVQRR